MMQQLILLPRQKHKGKAPSQYVTLLLAPWRPPIPAWLALSDYEGSNRVPSAPLWGERVFKDQRLSYLVEGGCQAWRSGGQEAMRGTFD